MGESWEYCKPTGRGGRDRGREVRKEGERKLRCKVQCHATGYNQVLNSQI